MKPIKQSDVLQLTLPERIQLVEDIWDSIIECPEAIELTESQKAELDKRLESYHQNPEAGSPWGLVREKIRKSL